MEKKSWLEEWGDRAYVMDRLVFIEQCVSCGNYFYEVYAVDVPPARTFAEVHCNSTRIFAESVDFKPVVFYEKTVPFNEWFHLSNKARKKVFKEIEAAFHKEYPECFATVKKAGFWKRFTRK